MLFEHKYHFIQNKLNLVLDKIQFIFNENKETDPNTDLFINDLIKLNKFDNLTSYIISKKGNEYRRLVNLLVKKYHEPFFKSKKSFIKDIIKQSLIGGQFTEVLTSQIIKGTDEKINKEKESLDYNTANDIIKKVINGEITSKSRELKGISKFEYILDKFDPSTGVDFLNFMGNPFTSSLFVSAKREVDKAFKYKFSARDEERKQSPIYNIQLNKTQLKQLEKGGVNGKMIEFFNEFYHYKKSPEEIKDLYNKQGFNGSLVAKKYKLFLDIVQNENVDKELENVKKIFIDLIRERGKANLANFFEYELEVRKNSQSSQLKKNLLPDIKSFKKFQFDQYIPRIIIHNIVRPWFETNGMDFSDFLNSLNTQKTGTSTTPNITGIKDIKKYKEYINKLKKNNANDIINYINIATTLMNSNQYDNNSLEDLFGNKVSTVLKTKIFNTVDTNIKDIFNRVLKNKLKDFGIVKKYEFDDLLYNVNSQGGWSNTKK